MSDKDAELIRIFTDESREHLAQLEPDLLALEQNSSDAELVNRIFRAVHSIKGSAGFFGFKPMNDVSHVMEDVISRVRDGALATTRDIVDALLAGKDKLLLMLGNPERCGEVDYGGEIGRLKQYTGGAATEKAKPVVSQPQPEPLPAPAMPGCFCVNRSHLNEAVKNGRFLYQVHLRLRSDIQGKNRSLQEFFQIVRSLGKVVDGFMAVDPLPSLAECLESDLSCEFLFSTVLEPDLVCMGLDLLDDKFERILPEHFNAFLTRLASAPVVAPDSVRTARAEPEAGAIEKKEIPAENAVIHAEKQVPDEGPAAAKAEVGPRVSGGDTIRVSVSLLDDLMNLAGEMVLGRNQLLRLAGAVSRDIPGLPALLQNINLVTSDLQEKVMHTRMQQVDSVFSRFPRMIRDLARKLGKEIDLKMTGEDVDMDKSIIETLSDPLTHLIRNCADHAIELPADREKSGKPRIGQVRLSAHHEGGQVIIEVSDDGCGMDPARLKRKATEKGFVKPDDAAKLSDREAISLIFLPGFSMAEKVTDVSGRGVGMDVVKTNIEKMGGSIELESELGVGSCVRLRLPLTLSIIPSMIVEVNERRFAVPQMGLEEIVRLDAGANVEKVRDVDVLRLRGSLLPLVHLKELLEMGESGAAGADGAGKASPKKQYVLVLKAGAHSFGLVVDALVDSEEIVVKPLSGFLKKCKCYSGVTIMGDGRVAMILDAAGIAECARLRFADIEREKTVAEAQARSQRSENQLLVLFRNAPEEVFALNLAMVNRIEKVKATDIQRIGNREYLKYREDSLRLVRLHDFMEVARPQADQEYVYVIVPKLVKHPMGIVASKIDDVIETGVLLDRNNVAGRGILGSAVIDNHLTVFLDLYELFEAADPDMYGWKSQSDMLSGKRVLLAEDTAFFRTVESDYLGEFGCQVDAVSNGVLAWDQLNKNEYDILVTDIEMPGMNGFELAQRVRHSERLRAMPIVALTALTSERVRERGDAAGVDAYETKLDKERLHNTLEKVLSARHGVNLPA